MPNTNRDGESEALLRRGNLISSSLLRSGILLAFFASRFLPPQPMLKRGEELQRGERSQWSTSARRARRGRARSCRGRGRAARSFAAARPACSASRGRPPTSSCCASRFAEDLARPGEHRSGMPGQARHLDAVGAVRAARRRPCAGRRPRRPTPSTAIVRFATPGGRARSRSARGSAWRRGRARLALAIVEVLGDRPRDREAVERRRCPAPPRRGRRGSARSRGSGCAPSRPSPRGTSTRRAPASPRRRRA